MIRRIMALLLCFACLVSLSGCARSSGGFLDTIGVINRGLQPQQALQAQPAQQTQGILGGLAVPTQPSHQLPPPIDTVCSQLAFEKYSWSDSGDTSLVYNDTTEGNQVIAGIEAYIAELKNYGYTLVRSEVRANCFYCYWLESTDPALDPVNYREQPCHLAIEGFLDMKNGWHSVYVYYSPTILNHYTGGTQVPNSSGGGGGSSWDFGGGGGGGTTIRCSKCGGDGQMTCTNCNGIGYKEKQVSTPNYSGNGPHRGTVRETCFKCHGSGSITCTRCGGAGRH